MEEKSNYFEVDAISNSSIVRFMDSPSLYYMEALKAPKRHFDLGSAIDCMITESNRFDELIEVADYKKPGPSTKGGKLVESLIISNKEGKEWDESLDIAIEVADYASKTKEKILEEFEVYRKYYESITGGSGKIILTYKELKLCKEIVKNLTIDQRCSKWFTSDEDGEVEFQKEIYWDCLGLACKSKLDVVKVNHKAKEVYITDIKTMSGYTFDFIKSILFRKYWMQGSFYTTAMTTLEGYDDYKFSFRFVVESTTNPGRPMCYKLSKEDILMGAMGGKIEGKWYKGFKEILHDIKWHKENNLWDYSREYYENECVETKICE